MKYNIDQIVIGPVVNGYKVNCRVNWNSNEYVFNKYEAMIDFITDLEIPFKSEGNGEEELEIK